MRCFPVIARWEGNLEIRVLDHTITQEVLEEHLVQAGQFIGLGSFRPENRGIYGRFKLVSLRRRQGQTERTQQPAWGNQRQAVKQHILFCWFIR